MAYAINDAGQITGDIVLNRIRYCFLYTPPGTTSGILFTSTPVSTQGCDARAINSTGWVTGSMYMPNTRFRNAFLRSPSNGQISNYPSIYNTGGAPPSNSFGWGVDDSENVVGEMDQSDPNEPAYQGQAAYSWNSSGTPIANSYYTQELATSRSGVYVALPDAGFGGSSQASLGLPNGPFLNAYCGYWDVIGGNVAAFSMPYAASNQGHAAGSSFCNENDDFNWHATFWGAQGVVDLGFAPSTAYTLSNDDWVVGNSTAVVGRRWRCFSPSIGSPLSDDDQPQLAP